MGIGSDIFNGMEPRLIQSQTQRLILSPQMRQYLRLLQLPLAQLLNTVEQELAENPALEEIQKEPNEETVSLTASETDGKQERNDEELRFDQALNALNKLDENMREGLYGQDDLSFSEANELNRQKSYQETLITKKESLFDFLLWQIGFLDLTEKELQIAEEITGNLTDEGFLTIPLEEVAKTCGASLEDTEKVLDEIQGLDPPGIAARNLQETLILQLERKGKEAEWALKIVKDHLPLLEKKQWGQISKLLNAPPEAIHQASKLIAHLDPKPGRSFYSDDPIAITPDASVYFDEENKLQIEVHDENLPELRINPYYRRMLKQQKLDPASRQFLKQKIQAALDFVRALGQRRSTLRLITDEIVAAQRNFFEKGFSELNPLRLKDISRHLGIHESTVSRAIQGKYISTPRGTVPYKSFFSSKLESTGGPESQKSMMEKIRDLIRSEDLKKPLSDQIITRVLQRQGTKIARRTVAKYRELLKILPSHLRAQK